MKKRSEKGFTLIELLLVIAIITALAAIVVPNYMKVSDESDTAVDLANKESLKAATRLLVLDVGLAAVSAAGDINTTNAAAPDLADYGGSYVHGPYVEGGVFPTPPTNLGTSYDVQVDATTGAIAITTN